jgi:preprotein translocase subunit SecE
LAYELIVGFLICLINQVEYINNMADKPTDKKTKKRLVKNPETFRERAVKANSDKPKRRVVITGAGKYSSKAFSPIGNASKKFASLPAVKPFKKPARILGKIILPVYFRNSWKELKLVTWPGWRQSRRLTYAVLVFAIAFGTVIATVDWGLSKLFKNILLK